jgi:anti-anti-sigma regulatory factor
MVFSFFKKQPQKMPERPAARPRAPGVHLPEVKRPAPPVEEVKPLAEPLPDLEFTISNVHGTNAATGKPVTGAPPLKPLLADDEFDMDGFERDFTESSVMAIDVGQDIDPLQADVEQAVVLFANSQDGAARALLETFIRAYPGIEGLRFWQLLFDLLQVSNDREAFEKLGVEFAQTCETSPPTWRELEREAISAPPGSKLFTLQGVLTDECLKPLAELSDVLSHKQMAVIDCGKLIGCDDEVAGQFADLLSRARRAGVSITLERPEAFLGRLNDRLQVGQTSHLPSWLLLLELLQRHGTQEQFEERAVDYAVTFEHSPPSWEAGVAKVRNSPTVPSRIDDAYYLSGELKSCRFEELVAVIEAHEVPVLDFSNVRRMDFFSAGQLVNRLAPYKAAGRDIIIRSPNHLVAELMAVVGLNKQARIIVPKS